MCGFKTKRSVYYVDTQRCLIWGGKLGNTARQYVEYNMLIGYPGYFKFVDGGVMNTGVIEDYI